ncbi:DNA-binding protein [Fodinibius salinus]|uniref:DNA-binding protein n=1 Tax=Fodinibius salinus TaxID=860790 RepID=A0A5D3YM96_9BACT|nr:HU family DNA-binding protein [Fodinibius salinus]TYP93817.1 DNA-binding protein [Fodinibius salinus]
MDSDFLQAFSEVVRNEVSQNNEVHVEGIGCFVSEHQKQYQKKFDDGRVVMMPPKNTISFIPKKDSEV